MEPPFDSGASASVAPPEVDRASGIGRNTLLNLGGALVTIVVALATVPPYLHTIGQTRYGVLSVVWLFFGYFGVFNLGLGRATANQIARLRTAPTAERERVFWTSLALNLGLGVAGAICLVAIGYPLLEYGVSMPAEVRTEAVHGLLWLALALPFLTLSMICTGALEGLERFDVVNGLQVATLTVYQLAPLAVAYASGPSLEWLLAAAASAVVLGGLAALGACRVLLLSGSRPRPDRRTARELFSYGGWVAVSEIVGPLLTITDRFVIGAMLGARAVTRYTVPYSLISRASILPISLARSLFPRLSLLSSEDAKGIARESTRVLAALATPMMVVAMLVVDPFLRVWIGGSFARSSAPVAEVILLGTWVNTLSFVPATFLVARGRPDLTAKFHMLELPPYLLALWIGLRSGGIEGAAWAWTARVVVDAGLLAAASRLYGRRDAVVLLSAVVVVLSYVAVRFAPAEGVVRVAVEVVLAAIACWAGWLAAPRRLRSRLLTIRPMAVKT